MPRREDSVISDASETRSRSNSAPPTPGLLTDDESEGYDSDGYEGHIVTVVYILPSFSAEDGPEGVAPTIPQYPPEGNFPIYQDSTATATPSVVDTDYPPEQIGNRLPLRELEDDSDAETIRETSPVPSVPGTYTGPRSRLSASRSISSCPMGVSVQSVADSSSASSHSPARTREHPEESSDSGGPVNDENAPPSFAPRDSVRHIGGKRRVSISSTFSSSRDSSPSSSHRPDYSAAPAGADLRPLHKRARR